MNKQIDDNDNDNEKIYIGTVYKVTNKTSGKCYIGQTIRDFNIRKKEHIYNSLNKNGEYYNCHFYRALRKYGLDDFAWEVIDQCSNTDKEYVYDTLFKLEEQYIENFNSFKNGYNLNLGGKGSKGRLVSDETRKKLRNINLGRICSDETKQKIRNSKLGNLLSDEHKNNIKQSSIKAFDKNTKIGLERCNIRSEKHKQKVKVFTEDGTLINIFDCIKDASLFYNNDKSASTKCCKRKLQTSGKFKNLRLIWRYLDDDFTIEDKLKLKPIIVEVYDYLGNYVNTFNSSKDVCEYYEIGNGSVSLTLQGKQDYCITKDKQKIKIKYKKFFDYESERN